MPQYVEHLQKFFDVNLKTLIPKKVDMLELLLRDGLQHESVFVPLQAKLWFADQIIKAGYKRLEVTNFSHPLQLPQSADAEEILKQVKLLKSYQEFKPEIKVYGMTKQAFERIGDMCQKGYGPDVVAFTISTEDLHGRRNSGRTRNEYKKAIPELVKMAKEYGFKIDMAIACVYGSCCAGPVPIESTFDLIDFGLDLGIREFTPCDTTGESNPITSYLHMAALVDRYSKYDNEMKYRIAHFHESRGTSIVNTVMAILGGARIVEASLGNGGGQPAYVFNGIPGCGSGPNYTQSIEVGNCSTEDILVCLDEMGIDTDGVNIDKMLQLGRVLEWTLGRTLPVWTTKAGRPIKQPVEWNISEGNLAYVPPYGPSQMYWADPSRYKPASKAFIDKQFEGRDRGPNFWDEKVAKIEESYLECSNGGEKAVADPKGRWFTHPKNV